MISTRIVVAIAAGVLVVGLLVGAAGSVLLGRASSAADGWGPGYRGMMGGGYGYGMTGPWGNGSWSYDDMLNEMREHMGWAPDGAESSPSPSAGAAQ